MRPCSELPNDWWNRFAAAPAIPHQPVTAHQHIWISGQKSNQDDFAGIFRRCRISNARSGIGATSHANPVNSRQRIIM